MIEERAAVAGQIVEPFAINRISRSHHPEATAKLAPWAPFARPSSHPTDDRNRVK